MVGLYIEPDLTNDDFKYGWSRTWQDLGTQIWLEPEWILENVFVSQNNMLDETNGVNNAVSCYNKKLSYCWETVRRESMPRIAEIDVEMTT